MSGEFRRASQMSGEWVYPNQALIWALWVLAAATEGETPSGRGGLSEGRVRGCPYLGGLTLAKVKSPLRGLWGPMEGCAVTSGHLINNVLVLPEAQAPESPQAWGTEDPGLALRLLTACGGLGSPLSWALGRGMRQSPGFCMLAAQAGPSLSK